LPTGFGRRRLGHWRTHRGRLGEAVPALFARVGFNLAPRSEGQGRFSQNVRVACASISTSCVRRGRRRPSAAPSPSTARPLAPRRHRVHTVHTVHTVHFVHLRRVRLTHWRTHRGRLGEAVPAPSHTSNSSSFLATRGRDVCFQTSA